MLLFFFNQNELWCRQVYVHVAGVIGDYSVYLLKFDQCLRINILKVVNLYLCLPCL